MDNSTQESHLRSENFVTYESPYPLYAITFSSSSSSTRSLQHHRIAVGSFVEEYNNRVDILSFGKETLSLKPNLSFEHCYPPTKLMFHPNPSVFTSAKSSDPLASSCNYLRL